MEPRRSARFGRRAGLRLRVRIRLKRLGGASWRRLEPAPIGAVAARRLSRGEQRWLRLAAPAALMVEEPGLSFESTAVAGERSRRPDHPVTGDDDRDRVGAVGGADGARGARRSQRFRDRAIARRLPGRNRAQRQPHLFLERRRPACREEGRRYPRSRRRNRPSSHARARDVVGVSRSAISCGGNQRRRRASRRGRRFSGPVNSSAQSPSPESSATMSPIGVARMARERIMCLLTRGHDFTRLDGGGFERLWT